MFVLKYTTDSELGRRFPSWVIATFRTRETAEAVVPTCPNASSIVVVEVGESSTRAGETGVIRGTIGAQVKTAPAARQRCDSGALPTNKESTDG